MTVPQWVKATGQETEYYKSVYQGTLTWLAADKTGKRRITQRERNTINQRNCRYKKKVRLRAVSVFEQLLEIASSPGGLSHYLQVCTVRNQKAELEALRQQVAAVNMVSKKQRLQERRSQPSPHQPFGSTGGFSLETTTASRPKPPPPPPPHQPAASGFVPKPPPPPPTQSGASASAATFFGSHPTAAATTAPPSASSYYGSGPPAALAHGGNPLASPRPADSAPLVPVTPRDQPITGVSTNTGIPGSLQSSFSAPQTPSERQLELQLEIAESYRKTAEANATAEQAKVKQTALIQGGQSFATYTAEKKRSDEEYSRSYQSYTQSMMDWSSSGPGAVAHFSSTPAAPAGAVPEPPPHPSHEATSVGLFGSAPAPARAHTHPDGYPRPHPPAPPTPAPAPAPSAGFSFTPVAAPAEGFNFAAPGSATSNSWTMNGQRLYQNGSAPPHQEQPTPMDMATTQITTPPNQQQRPKPAVGRPKEDNDYY